MRENFLPNNGMSAIGLLIAGATGTIATPAAGTDSAGHIVAVRNATQRLMLVTRLRVAVAFLPITTGDQIFGFDVFGVTGYTASHTGGAAMVPCEKILGTAFPAAEVPAAAELRIATTAALTDGTHAALTRRIGGAAASFNASAISNTMPPLVFEWRAPDGKALALPNNTGIVVRNRALVAAGGAIQAADFDMDVQLH